MKSNIRFLAIPGAVAASALCLFGAYEALQAFVTWADKLSPQGLTTLRTLCTVVPVIGTLCLSNWRRRRDARKQPSGERDDRDV